jgi:hypothetical protein
MSGDHNMNQIKEGYRHYDSPVAMPDLGSPREFTLDEYFSGLQKLMDDEDIPVQSTQIGGSHYQRAIQPWDIIYEWELDYWEGNVVKYILRWKHKDGVQDLKKAKHYLEYLIERELNDN